MACSHGGAAFLTNLLVAASLRRTSERERQVITRAAPSAPPGTGPPLGTLTWPHMGTFSWPRTAGLTLSRCGVGTMRYTRLHGFRHGTLGPAMWKMTRRAGKGGARIAGGLSDAELQVFNAFPTGSPVKLGPGNVEDDPPCREGWGPNQLVRAGFLISLLCGAVEVEPGLVGAVNIEGACVIGELGFPQVTFKHRLRLHDCYVPDGINLEEATVRTLLLDDCRIGAIYLLGAKIDGSLSLSGAYVGGKGRRAMAADRLAITGNIWCDKGFQSYGEIGLSGASIGGQLVFRDAHLDGNGESALTADGLKVTDAMFCDERVSSLRRGPAGWRSHRRSAPPQCRAPGRERRICPDRRRAYRHRCPVLSAGVPSRRADSDKGRPHRRRT